ncbi:MAG: hypothetical protein COZ06_27875 [Armatimonadetes bacterium CG_4_10_14_3_um_filter_66_18]|nr:hypothetical protein [Armatimonadota bacterium]OIO96499.1 MAG: hypothetical protein AUJ96_24635 [Armatimonadetes bacterium CG2_30_66_41]PIU94089.1 MAG: hypothetical protein COS65_09415 [Armatimonadetes bacterium CG06_land_8_20_14_3_00_66_21]PIY40614.1 MAG: hypothetical protein COZ06_27875 [Armatimonadetes bacterium CG_4_10_14_3_um_filter_66_18]PIZ41510.1 MAG: hypothetical protein COY42_19190 [Armatimonadetes bacterium CG_4_10_14_0_8_um_filter_66_14]PJB75201.1 MAG: hypothetical protein CO096
MPAATDPPQLPLCMIGDSITWADEGDYWREYLLQRIPRLAFVGTHSAKLGYSHAGEGGNGTQAVLNRLDAIPDCPFYALEIGTNDNNIREEAQIEDRAAATAARIEAIVRGLLKKPSVQKVFLGSVLPCQTDNPLRDRTNSATNVQLRKRLESAFPEGRVVWVEYERPIRALDNWGPLIRLHPTKEGYQVLARILAGAIAAALDLQDTATVPTARSGCGVRVDNLWEDATEQPRAPVIAGWYTLSFELTEVAGDKPSVTVRSVGESIAHPFAQAFPVAPGEVGKRVTLNFFTQYEGYGYTRSKMTVAAEGCEIGRVLFEKRRPSGEASDYGKGSYLDVRSTPRPGELIECPQ